MDWLCSLNCFVDTVIGNLAKECLSPLIPQMSTLADERRAELSARHFVSSQVRMSLALCYFVGTTPLILYAPFHYKPRVLIKQPCAANCLQPLSPLSSLITSGVASIASCDAKFKLLLPSPRINNTIYDVCCNAEWIWATVLPVSVMEQELCWVGVARAPSVTRRDRSFLLRVESLDLACE